MGRRLAGWRGPANAIARQEVLSAIDPAICHGKPVIRGTRGMSGAVPSDDGSLALT